MSIDSPVGLLNNDSSSAAEFALGTIIKADDGRKMLYVLAADDFDKGDFVAIDEDAPVIIKLSDEDHIEEEKEEDSGALGVIYPDDDQSNTSSEGADIDFMDALEKLDEEDEDPGEFNELPEL